MPPRQGAAADEHQGQGNTQPNIIGRHNAGNRPPHEHPGCRSTLCGLASVAILAFLAKYLADRGATATALTLFGASTASMVSVFVANRSKKRR